MVAVRKDTSFKDMAALLREHRVSVFPVLDDDGKVIGVVSEADMLPKEALDGGHASQPGMITGMLHRREQQKADGVTAADLMTSPAVTICSDRRYGGRRHLGDRFWSTPGNAGRRPDGDDTAVPGG